jgi:hypothetical protein
MPELVGGLCIALDQEAVPLILKSPIDAYESHMPKRPNP